MLIACTQILLQGCQTRESIRSYERSGQVVLIWFLQKAQGIHSRKSKYKKVGVLPIRIVKSNVSSVGPLSERNTDCCFLRSKRQTLLSVSAVHFGLSQ